MSSLREARCLVLGAGGFIGSNLCRELLSKGAIVTGMGRAPRARTPGHGWIDSPIEDAAALRSAAADADLVFHLLGSADPGASNINPVADARVTVPASLAVLEACRDNNVRRLVFLSSGGAVYRPGLPIPISEDAPTDPISAYGIGKLTVEKYCSLFNRLYGLETVSLRVANPFGPFQDPDRGQGFIAKLIKRALINQPIEIWGDGGVIRDFLYVADLVDAILAAADRPIADRVFNIGSGQGRTLRSVVDDVRRELNLPTPVRYGVVRVGDPPANTLDISRAASQLSWHPTTSWEDGLRLTCNWLKRQKAGD